MARLGEKAVPIVTVAAKLKPIPGVDKRNELDDCIGLVACGLPFPQ